VLRALDDCGAISSPGLMAVDCMNDGGQEEGKSNLRDLNEMIVQGYGRSLMRFGIR